MTGNSVAVLPFKNISGDTSQDYFSDGLSEELRSTLARNLKLDNVIFAGWRNDVPSIMKAASVLVLPSRVEAFGRVIPEAWACGIVRTIGFVNFLDDPTQQPHMRMADIDSSLPSRCTASR